MEKKENIQFSEIEERLEMAQVAAASKDRCIVSDVTVKL